MTAESGGRSIGLSCVTMRWRCSRSGSSTYAMDAGRSRRTSWLELLSAWLSSAESSESEPHLELEHFDCATRGAARAALALLCL